MQLPLPLGALPLPEAVELQAQGQRQVQQGDQAQQPVARPGPQVLCRRAVEAELSRTPGDSQDRHTDWTAWRPALPALECPVK